MKLLVETKGDFQFYGRGDDHHAVHDRPSVVINSNLMASRVAKGDLIVLSQLSDEATDAEFVKNYNAEKPKESVEAFIGVYGLEAEERKLKAEGGAKGGQKKAAE